MKSGLRKAGIFIVVFLHFVSANAGGDFGVSVYHTRGVFWAHKNTILQLEAPTRGIDINLTWFTENNKKKWTPYYRHPRVGVSLSYLNLGIPEVTGNAFGILPFIEFRLVQSRRHELNFRWATGLGYLTKKWDLESNIQNRAIGSHFNANMRAHLMYHVLPTDKLELSLSLGMTHYSNGNMKMPNLGANCVEMGLGIGFNRRTPKVPDSVVPSKGKIKGSGFEIRYTIGTKETSLIYTKRIFPSSLSGRYFIWKSRKHRWHGGVEFFFDQGRLYKDNPADVTERPNLSNSLDIGTHLGHELWLGRLHFITEFGFYVYSPTHFKGFLYQRLGFKYTISRHWNASVALKTHFSRADLFEWGIGYTIFR